MSPITYATDAQDCCKNHITLLQSLQQLPPRPVDSAVHTCVTAADGTACMFTELVLEVDTTCMAGGRFAGMGLIATGRGRLDVLARAKFKVCLKASSWSCIIIT